MTNITDRRVQKTRQLMQQAIMELIVEKGFDSIKVQDILDKANVGRSTFYAHYQDKAGLLHSCFEEVNKLMEQQALTLPESPRDSLNLDFSFDFTLNIFKFAERNCPLFKALIKQWDLSEIVADFLFDYLNAYFKRWMAKDKNSSISSQIATNYFICAFSGTLKWWVRNNMPCKAEEIDKYFRQLAMPTIKNISLRANRFDVKNDDGSQTN
jgi:AcrR family transcriptional regulator